jgi:hypothetical protein
MSTDPHSDGGSNLPVYCSPSDRHDAQREVGIHPTLTSDDDFWAVRDDIAHGLVIDDGHTLIGRLDGGACPVCGERDQLQLVTGFRGRGIEERVEQTLDSGETARRTTPLLKRLDNAGYRPVVCKGGVGRAYFVGLAGPDAVRTYEEWDETRSERETFQRHVDDLRSHEGLWDSTDLLAPKYDAGHFIAALFEELGAEAYDPTDLIGRTSVTKTQLAVLLDRVLALEHSPRRDYSEEDWGASVEFGIVQGHVQFAYPEWVDTDDGLFAERRHTLFE